MPSGSRPAVSILIPAYNAQSYLAETLESALDQTFRSFEIIVVDDGSTDDTRAIAERYRARGVSVLTQPNAGAAAARNRGLSAARGKLIALLDSDDVWERDCLHTMVGFLESHPDVSVAFCDSLFFGETPFAGKTYQQIYPPSPPITFTKVAGCVSHICLDAILRREVFDRVGMFDETLLAAEDFDLWLRVLHAGCRIEPIPRVLVRYRRHGASVSAQSTRAHSAALQVLEKWRGEACVDGAARAAIEGTRSRLHFYLDVRHALDHVRAGEFVLARAALRRACAYRPKWRYRAAQLGLAIAPGLTRLALRRMS